jgi:hypothetical protein
LCTSFEPLLTEKIPITEIIPTLVVGITLCHE